MADEHAFCRHLLRETMSDVRKHTTAAERKASWGYRYDYGDDVEFHGPGDYYWHGSGCCVWIARAYGWSAWLNKHVTEEN